MSVTAIRMLWVFALAVFLARSLPPLKSHRQQRPYPRRKLGCACLCRRDGIGGDAGRTRCAIETPRASSGGINPAAGNLPRDLSAWNMFRSADHIVKGVIIGLAIGLDCHLDRRSRQIRRALLLKRKLLPALGTLEGARSLSEAQADARRPRAGGSLEPRRIGRGSAMPSADRPKG